MTATILTVRITLEQKQRWTAAAAGEGLMLSDWVRRRCDGTRIPTIQNVGMDLDGPKISETAVDSGRRTVRRGKSVVDKIQDVANETLRKNLPAPTDLCSHEYGLGACPFPNCANYKWRK